MNLFNLNTKKYLDYVDWYKAYQLIKENAHLSIDGQKVILNLKSGMNSKRSNINLPINHKLIITKYWLLGFTEGDGSFNCNGKFRYPWFILANNKESAYVFYAIKSF